MEILIIGAGAVGGLFGALLAPVTAVTFFTTNAAHAEAINRDGLALTGMDGRTRRIPATALTDPRRYGRRADLALVCTKARATARAAETAGLLLADDGLALTLQNGLGNLEQIQDAVGKARAAAGTTAQAATLLGPGLVRHAGAGPTVLGAGHDQADKVASVADLFNRAGIPATITGDVEALLWSKLVVNVGINALTALLRVPNGTLAEFAECDALMDLCVAEAEAVARALGVALPGGDQLQRIREVCARTSANRSSMLQDILAGRSTEVEVINGAVVRLGEESGVPTPVNALLTQLVKALEATTGQRIPY